MRNGFLIIFLLFLLLSSCSDKYAALVSRYQTMDKPSEPDYADLDHWAAHPWKQDPSDSVPLPLKQETRDSIADVFFIHPTTYTASRNKWNADVNDAYLNAKTDYSTILYQSTVFNQHSRIFAPRYRQAHLSAFFTDQGHLHPSFDTAYFDIQKAFSHYLQNHNHGRPVIIAGHSQGGLMAIKLVNEFFDNNSSLQHQLVAAYIIGWPVPFESFETIKPCNDSLQTGCFVSWRTYRTNYIPSYVKKEPRVYVTNPISWTTMEGYAPPFQNTGSILRDFNKLIKHAAGAGIHGNVLWTDKPKFPGSIFFRTKNYHIADINLYYMNIRQNVEQRIQAFFSNPGKN